MSGRPAPPDTPATRTALRQVRLLILSELEDGTAFQKACEAGCSESTMRRIIDGDNLSFRTAARILEHLGFQLTVSKKALDVAVPDTESAA